MYLGSRPRRRSPRLTILLLLMILAATLLVYYVATQRPAWSTPFEPTPTATRPASSYVAEAEAYYGEGQLDEAIIAYQQAASLAPDDSAVHARLAHLLVFRERTAEALEEAKTAVRLAPSNPPAVAAFCRALDWEGLYAEALEACECAIELDSRYAEAQAYLSEVYADVGNWAAARKYAQQAIDLNYQSMDAHRNQGYAYEMQGRFSKAVEAYENAIILQPRLAPLYISVARNYRAMGKFKEAIDRLERVIRFDPNSPVAYDQLGWTYYTKGDYNRAAEYLEQATVVEPAYTQAWGHLGIVSYITQQYEEAIRYFQQAVQLALTDYLNRGRQVVILEQDASYDPPRSVEVMRGELLPLDRRGVDSLVAQLSPVLPRKLPVPQSGETCGDAIAARLAPEISVPTIEPTVGSSATVTAVPDDAFQKTQGRAVVDLKNRRFEVRLTNLPRPATAPYEVQMVIWPGKSLTLGSLQPDQTGGAALTYSFEDTHPAPVEYYYSLGFSYVYLDQCDKGVPWLLIALDIDSSAGNPAWQGLAECPEGEPTTKPGATPAAP